MSLVCVSNRLPSAVKIPQGSSLVNKIETISSSSPSSIARAPPERFILYSLIRLFFIIPFLVINIIYFLSDFLERIVAARISSYE